MMSYNKRKGITLMLLSSLCVCLGQLLWKLSISLGILYLFFGFCLYGIGAVIMLYAYRFGKLSVLQPVLSMNYVLSTLLGVLVLGESFSLKAFIGIAIIIVGVIVLGGSDK